MKISEVIDVLDEFNSDVVYSDITSEVHFSCSCGCGGDSYDDESWEAMSNTYDATEKKVEEFCNENNLVYDWGVEDGDISASEYVDKTSFDTLFYLYSSSNISAVKDDYDVEQDYYDMLDYYQEDQTRFIEFCVSLGFENDLLK